MILIAIPAIIIQIHCVDHNPNGLFMIALQRVTNLGHDFSFVYLDKSEGSY